MMDEVSPLATTGTIGLLFVLKRRIISSPNHRKTRIVSTNRMPRSEVSRCADLRISVFKLVSQVEYSSIGRTRSHLATELFKWPIQSMRMLSLQASDWARAEFGPECGKHWAATSDPSYRGVFLYRQSGGSKIVWQLDNFKRWHTRTLNNPQEYIHQYILILKTYKHKYIMY